MTEPIRVNAVQSQTTQSGSQVTNRAQSGSSFADTLAKVEGLRFSNHAQSGWMIGNQSPEMACSA